MVRGESLPDTMVTLSQAEAYAERRLDSVKYMVRPKRCNMYSRATMEELVAHPHRLNHGSVSHVGSVTCTLNVVSARARVRGCTDLIASKLSGRATTLVSGQSVWLCKQLCASSDERGQHERACQSENFQKSILAPDPVTSSDLRPGCGACHEATWES